MSYPIVKCDRHKQESGYAVCVHVFEKTSPVFFFENATEKDMGQILCRACHESNLPPTIETARVVCPSCARENNLIPVSEKTLLSWRDGRKGRVTRFVEFLAQALDLMFIMRPEKTKVIFAIVAEHPQRMVRARKVVPANRENHPSVSKDSIEHRAGLKLPSDPPDFESHTEAK